MLRLDELISEDTVVFTPQTVTTPILGGQYINPDLIGMEDFADIWDYPNATGNCL